MTRLLRIALLTALLLLLTSGTVWAQEVGADTDPNSVTNLLLPLVAAATAIERIIEMVFNWYEGVVLNLGRFFGIGGDYLTWLQTQVRTYREQMLRLHPTNPRVKDIEDKLYDAENCLRDYIKSPMYTSYKRAVALLMGLIIGVFIALTTNLRMFALLGIADVPSWLDQVITGLIIGTGSAPVHSLISILQNTQEAIDEARALWRGRALSEVSGMMNTLNQQAQAAQRNLATGGGASGSADLLSAAEVKRRADDLLRSR